VHPLRVSPFQEYRCLHKLWICCAV
jgi:hypothetical protein